VPAAAAELAVALRGQEAGHQRLRISLAGVGAGVLGAAPHVLHHVGPLAGAALLAGAAGTALFGVLGLLAAVPLLRRMHRRSGSWRLPGAAAALMAGAFALSSVVVGPAISGEDDGDGPQGASPTTPADHREHH